MLLAQPALSPARHSYGGLPERRSTRSLWRAGHRGRWPERDFL